MAMVDVDDSSYTGGFTAQVGWLGLRVGSRLALFYIHQMNRVNSLLVIMRAPKTLSSFN